MGKDKKRKRVIKRKKSELKQRKTEKREREVMANAPSLEDVAERWKGLNDWNRLGFEPRDPIIPEPVRFQGPAQPSRIIPSAFQIGGGGGVFTPLRLFRHLGGHIGNGPRVYIHRFESNLPGNKTFMELLLKLHKMLMDMASFVRDTHNLPATARYVIRMYALDRVVTLTTIAMPFTPELATVALDNLESILNSNDSIDIHTSEFSIRATRFPAAGANHYHTLADFYTTKSVIRIHAEHNNCLFQCILLAQTYGTPQYKYWIRHKKYLSREATRLKNATVEEHLQEEGVALDSLNAYEEEFGLKFFVMHAPDLNMMYQSSADTGKECFLLFSDDHFDFITKPHTLFKRRHFCRRCFKGVEKAHHCKDTDFCKACGSMECVGINQENPELECKKCSRSFFNKDCFIHHRENEKCKTTRYCKKCECYYGKGKHKCYHFKCFNCKEFYDYREGIHKCFMRRLSEKELKPPSEKYIFYDYETHHDAHHEFGIAVAAYMEGEPHVFDTEEAWIKWLFKKEHDGYTAIAHNGGKFDTHIVLESVFKHHYTISGRVGHNSLMQVCVAAPGCKIRFIDSIKLIPGPLSAFNKNFGITSVEKGFFPFKFWTKANRRYVGPVPPISAFEVHKKKQDEADKIVQWHSDHSDDIIDIFKVCVEYCIDDVKLLREGCLRYRKMIMELSENLIDPFQYLTVASLAMTFWRVFDLPEDTLAILPNQYTDEGRERWEIFHQDYPRVEDGFMVNGVLNLYANCQDTGCSKCYQPWSLHPTQQTCYRDLRHRWMTRINSYDGVQAIKIWKACYWQQSKKAKAIELESVHVNYDTCVKGGRTEVFKPYYNGPVKYLDFKSLYPSVQYGQNRSLGVDKRVMEELEYPVGHPEILINPDIEEILPYMGICVVDIHPPENYEEGTEPALLPAHQDGKLFFDMRTKYKYQSTIIEIKEAVKRGWIVSKVYEAHIYKKTSTELFKSYVRRFFKIKEENGGIPGNPEEYRQEVRDHLGIELGEFQKNPGMKFIAKLFLNSLWGKLGERDKPMQYDVVYNDEDFVKLLVDDDFDFVDVDLHHGGAITVHRRKRVHVQQVKRTRNMLVAAHVTTYGRLRLFQFIELVGDLKVYCDTDSLIFIDDKNLDLTEGDMLGDLEDEEPNDQIVETIALGPKTYAYKTASGKTKIKAKGVTLNVECSELVNFDVMKQMVFDNDYAINVPQFRMNIHPDHTISNYYGEKIFRWTFDKRKVLPFDGKMINTVPFKNGE